MTGFSAQGGAQVPPRDARTDGNSLLLERIRKEGAEDQVAHAQLNFVLDHLGLVVLVLSILIRGGREKLGWSIVKVAVIVLLAGPGGWILGAVMDAMVPVLLFAFLAGLIFGAVLLTRALAKRWPEALAQIEFWGGLALAAVALQVSVTGFKQQTDPATYVLMGLLPGMVAVFKLHKAYEKTYRAKDGGPAAAPSKTKAP